MKKLHLLAAALVACLATPAAFAGEGQMGQVSATVPSLCAITYVDDVHADFGFNMVNASGQGQITVMCNKDSNYTLWSTQPNTEGRFIITNLDKMIDMEVEMTDGDTGLLWTDTYTKSLVGEGNQQYFNFSLNFNPDAEYLPASGEFQGTVSFAVAVY